MQVLFCYPLQTSVWLREGKYRSAMLPEDFLMGEQPCVTVVGVALVEEVGAAVGVGEDVGMARLTGVPVVGVAVAEEGLVGQTLPADAIVAHGYANLLWHRGRRWCGRP